MIVILVDIILTILLLIADLLSKHFVAAALKSTGSSVEVIKDVLTFRYSENRGAAFGIFENARVLLCVFVGVVVIGLIAFMVYHIVKGKHKEKGGLLLHISLSLIVAGGLGNLVDRIALGYVRDFIEYTIVYTLFKKNFAICNLADVFLTIGVILLIIYLIFFYAMSGNKKNTLSKTKNSPLEASTKSLKDDKEDLVSDLQNECDDRADDSVSDIDLAEKQAADDDSDEKVSDD